MTRRPPKNDEDLVALVERALDSVPLDAAEVTAAVRETGIDARRLGARVHARVEAVKQSLRVAAFEEAERQHKVATITIQQRMQKRGNRTPAEARARLLELRDRGGSLVETHFHKLESVSDADICRLVDEIEALLDDHDE